MQDMRQAEERRGFLRSGLIAVGSGLLLSDNVLAQAAATITPSDVISGIMTNNLSHPPEEVLLALSVFPMTSAGPLQLNGFAKVLQSGNEIPYSIAIPSAIFNNLGVEPDIEANSYVITYNNRTGFDEHASVYSLKLDNVAGTSGTFTNSFNGSTFTFIRTDFGQSAASVAIQTKAGVIQPTIAPAIAIIIGVGVVALICGAVALLQGLINDCVKQAQAQCGQGNVKMVTVEVTLGVNFRSGTVGCGSTCIIECGCGKKAQVPIPMG